MTSREKQLILDLVTGSITEDEFLAQFPGNVRDENYLPSALDEAYAQKNCEDVEYLLHIGFRWGFTRASVGVLCRLLAEGWHKQHENIASVLQELRPPESVDVLYDAAVAEYEYLDYDEAYALAVKCCWALGDIGTIEARGKLEQLTKDRVQAKREAAVFQLERIGKP